MRRLEEIAVATLSCRHCNAKPQGVCVTKSWAVATRTHSARLRPLEEAWRVGFHEGGTMVIDHVARQCDPDRADLDPRGTLTRTLERVRTWFQP